MKNKFKTCLISLSLIVICMIVFIYVRSLNKETNEDMSVIKLAEVTHSVFYTPMYVAIENGYFEEEGIKIDLILTPGADKVSAAVLSGDVNIGFAGAESAIYIYESGETDYLQIFAGLTKRDGQFIVSRENIEDFDIDDLLGKEVLAGRSSGMPALNFINSLDNAGIDIDALNVNTNVDFSALTGTFIGGEGDFVNLFEPNATLLEKEGYGYVVASVGELSGEVPYTTFYAKTSYINNNKELIDGFTNAINKGLEYTLNTDENIVAEAIISQFPDTNINDLSSMIKRYRESDSWLSNPFVSEQSFNNLEEFLIKFNLLEEKTSYDNIVNNFYE